MSSVWSHHIVYATTSDRNVDPCDIVFLHKSILQEIRRDKRLWMTLQQESKQTFPTLLNRRRVLMVEGEIMDDELDFRIVVIVMKVDFEEILPCRTYVKIEGMQSQLIACLR